MRVSDTRFQGTLAHALARRHSRAHALPQVRARASTPSSLVRTLTHSRALAGARALVGHACGVRRAARRECWQLSKEAGHRGVGLARACRIFVKHCVDLCANAHAAARRISRWSRIPCSAHADDGRCTSRSSRSCAGEETETIGVDTSHSSPSQSLPA
eukprot:4743931-Pleurochrysis_carterae.AAC.3